MNPLERQYNSVHGETSYLQGFTLGHLPAKQKRFRKPAGTTNLERTEVFVPITIRHVRSRFDPDSKFIEVGDVNRPIMHSFDQALAEARWQIAPIPNLRHQPKTIRPICSPSRLTSSGSLALRKRSAKSKNACCFCFSASMPFSISSTNMRFALRRRVRAIVRTCAATFAGRLTLCRTALFAALMAPLCTRLVREWAQTPIRYNRQGIIHE